MRELREQVLRGEWEEAAVVLIVLLIIGFVIYRSKKRNQSPELGDMLRQRDERIAELERLIATQPRHVIKEVHVASGTRAADGSEYFARGIQHEKDYNYDAALADFTRAIEVEPNALHYRTRAWFFWWRRKNTSLAIADYSKAIELGSAAGDYLGRAGMYWEIGNYDRAMADINRAIHLNPQELLYYYLRGLLYQVKGDLRAAKSDLAAVASHHGGEFGRCAQIALKALGKGEKGEWLHGHF
jgi:tetratricopeptide (TPR) repeat protein